MRNLNRRQFVRTAGAGLLLAPFLSLGMQQRRARAAGAPKAKRLLLFCTMGTYPPLWSPTGVKAENQFTFGPCTTPLAAIKDSLILIEGCPSLNTSDGHGAPDGLTGLGYAQTGQVPIISVDQFIANALTASGVSVPIPSLLLGADTTASGGKNMFYGGSKNGSTNLTTIGSPLSAFTTVFGGALPMGTSMGALMKRRKSILDNLTGELTSLQSTLGSAERHKVDLHLASVRQLESKLAQMATTPSACMKPATPPADSTYGAATTQTIQQNLVHQDIILNAFACDITRVAAIQYGSDQLLRVNVSGLPADDQHGGYIHSGADSNYKNLLQFEQYLSQQFVYLVNKLKTMPEADGSGMLLDNTIVAWCRDMGDATVHNQESMRFVIAGGKYLKTDPNGRYLDLRKSSAPANRHERVLLSLCDALGITTFKGFGDPNLGANKTPLPGISA